MSNPTAFRPYCPNDGESPITPDDATILPADTVGLVIGTGGDISVDFIGGATAQIYTVPDGFLFPGLFKRVRATGTTAAKIGTLRARSSS